MHIKDIAIQIYWGHQEHTISDKNEKNIIYDNLYRIVPFSFRIIQISYNTCLFIGKTRTRIIIIYYIIIIVISMLMLIIQCRS